MKRIYSILLAFIFLFAFSACAKKAPTLTDSKDTPIKIEVILDSEGYQQHIVFVDETEISEFMELFDQVKVGEMTDLMTTDSYNSISLYYADGSCTLLSITGGSLEAEVDGAFHYYTLDNLNTLWSYIRSHADTPAIETEGGGS